MEGALGSGFVAGEGGEGVGACAVVAKRVSVVVRRGDSGAAHEIALQFEVPELEETGFHGGAAAEAPSGDGELMNELGLGGGGWLVLVVEGLEELVEFVFVFPRQQDGLGGESMLEGVKADGGASFGGFGAGAAESVAAVGVDLFQGCHCVPRVAHEMRRAAAGL